MTHLLFTISILLFLSPVFLFFYFVYRTTQNKTKTKHGDRSYLPRMRTINQQHRICN